MTSTQSIKQRYGIVGRSETLDRALDTAIKVANTDLTVLIFGESGVGKEAFSKIIHDLSSRKHNNFIPVNCGAIPEGTINSELFGHEKGSFTGAIGDRKGYFETVDGGTIFLDEIAEMPLDTQAYLLRVLESGEFIKVGASKVQRTDVRVIAATNVDLEERVKNGKFREDLYYRLNTVPIRVPALRQRREDIMMLFRKFTLDFAEKYRTTPIQLDERGQLILENYAWPGNVRELKNVSEQLSVLAKEKLVSVEELVQIMPQLMKRNLPMIPDRTGDGANLQEREILYKLLFEMKSDLNDLKNLVFELIRSNDLSVRDHSYLRQLGSPSVHDDSDAALSSAVEPFQPGGQGLPVQDDFYHNLPQTGKPIVLDNTKQSAYSNMEVVEESLSLEDMEKDLILRALKKHAGRRKEAAQDLGISERTLYRKIKQYDI